jgi:hypothetical protein
MLLQMKDSQRAQKAVKVAKDLWVAMNGANCEASFYSKHGQELKKAGITS